MRMKKVVVAAIGLALTGGGVGVNAQTASRALTPSLTITTGCTVATALSVSGFAFPNTAASLTAGGAYTLTSVIGTVNVAGECKKYYLGADAGAHYTAGVRQLASGGNKIPYSLKLDSVLGLSGLPVADWGTIGLPTYATNPTTAGGQAAFHNNRASPKGSADVYTITGIAVIPMGVVPGTYTDTVTVVIEF